MGKLPFALKYTPQCLFYLKKHDKYNYDFFKHIAFLGQYLHNISREKTTNFDMCYWHLKNYVMFKGIFW